MADNCNCRYGYSIPEQICDLYDKCDEVKKDVDNLEENKTDLTGDHKGTWQGYEPTEVDPAAQAVLDKLDRQVNDDDIIYYVDSNTGLDTNDGLSVSTPFKTIQKAFNEIETQYIAYGGTFTIQLADGLYNQSATFNNQIPSVKRINIKGNVDVNGEPSVFFDGSGLNSSGLLFNQDTFIYIENINFTNYSTGSQLGSCIIAQHGSNLYTKNVWCSNSEVGIAVVGNCRIYVEGGVIDNCGYGIRLYGNCLGTIGYNSGVEIKNCNTYGVILQNCSTAHVDYSTIDNCNWGIYLVNMSRVHALSNEIKNNSIGVQSEANSTWYDNGNTYTNNTRNYGLYSGSNEYLRYKYSKDIYQTFYDVLDNVLSGTTTKTTLKSIKTVEANTMTAREMKLSVDVSGSLEFTGAKDIGVDFGSVEAARFTANGLTGDYVMNVQIIGFSATNVRVRATLIENGYSQVIDSLISVDNTIDNELSVFGQLADTGGRMRTSTITLEENI